MAARTRSAALVRELLARELDTVTAYAEMTERSRTPAVRELLERVTREEKHHIGEAMDLLARLDAGQAAALEALGLQVGAGTPEARGAAAPAAGASKAGGAPAGRVRYEPAGLSVDVAAGETLLAAALRSGVDIRHDCGGVGRCGTCRVEVPTGTLTDVTDPERHHLGELLGAQWRLACQTRPLTDASVVVPPNKKRAAEA
jgi:ferredoxin